MSTTHSVSQWISSLKTGEMEGIQKLWDRYRPRLVELARQRLKTPMKRVADEDDIAQCVFISLCRGAQGGRFDALQDRDDLWWLLLAISKQKIANQIRHEMARKRGSGRVQSETGLGDDAGGERRFSLDELVGEAPTPDFILMMEEQNQLLFEMLRDDRLRSIALLRIEGYSVGEIAASLGVSTRSIERKLNLIRNAWNRELARAERQAGTA